MIRTAFASLLALACAAPALSGPLDDVAEVDILPGWRTEDGTHMAALRVRLAPGWKTYWRAPGDAGIPPHFDWTGSSGVTAMTPHWPIPDVFYPNGMRTIGYDRELILPMEFTLSGHGDTVVAGTVELGICEEVCMPVRFDFAASLPLEGTRDTAIVAALLDQPAPARDAGLRNATCALAPTEDGMEIDVSLDMPDLPGSEIVVIEAGDPLVWVSEAETDWQGGILTANAEMLHVNGGAFAVDRSALRATVIADDIAVDIRGCDAP